MLLNFNVLVSEPDLAGSPRIVAKAKFGGKSSRCRFTLERYWANQGPLAVVIGCNPSTADALKDDPTSRWWKKWFQAAGYRGYVAVNLYPFCTSSPTECRRKANWEACGDWYARDDIQLNLSVVAEAAKIADAVFVCWGAIAWDLDWIEYVVEEIQSNEEPYPDLLCWGLTANGAPKHPLARGRHRIPPDQKPIPWRLAEEVSPSHT